MTCGIIMQSITQRTSSNRKEELRSLNILYNYPEQTIFPDHGISHCCSSLLSKLLSFFISCAQALIPLSLEGTDAGKVKACYALARITAVSNPEIAFPGERVRSVTETLFPSMFVQSVRTEEIVLLDS